MFMLNFLTRFVDCVSPLKQSTLIQVAYFGKTQRSYIEQEVMPYTVTPHADSSGLSGKFHKKNDLALRVVRGGQNNLPFWASGFLDFSSFDACPLSYARGCGWYLTPHTNVNGAM